MGGPRWNNEECEYFLQKIVPKSKYSSGQYSRHGLDFEELAKQMQRDMDALRIGGRIYTGAHLYQRWYALFKAPKSSHKRPNGYQVPSQPGGGTSMNHPGGINVDNVACGTYSSWLEDPSSPVGGLPLSDSGLFYDSSLFQPADNFMASTSNSLPAYKLLPPYNSPSANSLQQANYDMVSASSFKLPTLPTSTHIPSSTFHAFTTASDSTNSLELPPLPTSTNIPSSTFHAFATAFDSTNSFELPPLPTSTHIPSSTFHASATAYDSTTFDSTTFDSNTFDSNTFHSNTFDSNTFHSNTFHSNTFHNNTFHNNTFDSNTFDSNTFDSTTFDSTNSFTMASSPNLNAILGIVDESLLDHGNPVSFGEASTDDRKRTADGTDHGETATQPITKLPDHIDTTDNNRKRNADDTTDLGDPSTQTAAKKTRSKAAELKYKIPDSVAELQAGSDPASPSPAGKKTRGRGKPKAAIPRKSKKAVDDGDAAAVASSSLEDKKPKTVAARRKKTSKATSKPNNDAPLSIPSGDDDMATEENTPEMAEAVMMKHGGRPYVAGGTKGRGTRGGRGGRGGRGQARGGDHQRALHQFLAAHQSFDDSDDGGDSDEDEDMMEQPLRRKEARPYQEYQVGGMGGRSYAAHGPPPPYYPAPPANSLGSYPGAPPGLRPNPSYQVNNHHSPYFSYGPLCQPTLYNPHDRVGTASHSDLGLHPNMVPLAPFGVPPSYAPLSQQANVGGTSDRRTGGYPVAPRPTSSQQPHFLSVTGHPNSSMSNNPSSVHGPEQSTKEEVAGGAQRPHGPIYGFDGTATMVVTCPCCRRGFE